MPTLSTRLKAAKAKKSIEPVWKGPEEDGITQSLLSRFLVCRERFRLRVVEGLAPKERFNSRMEYGSMWHAAEESLAAGKDWKDGLLQYCKTLCDKYRLDQDQIDHWYRMATAQFPVYVEYWSKHQDVKGRVPLFQEQVFNVPYKLPSGRTVRLRGKWDAGDYLPAHTENGYKYPAGVWLQENKTKSQLDQQKIVRQLSFDLQTLIYIVALQEYAKNGV